MYVRVLGDPAQPRPTVLALTDVGSIVGDHVLVVVDPGEGDVFGGQLWDHKELLQDIGNNKK